MRLAVDHPLQLGVGMTVWALWFTVTYAGVSLACSVAPPEPMHGSKPWINGTLLLLTLATVALLAWAAWACARAARTLPSGREAAHRRFIAHGATVLYAAAAVATAFVGVPLLVLPPCV